MTGRHIAGRGVFEVHDEFPGTRTFHVITSCGCKCLEVRATSDDVSETLIEFLEDWLNQIDPPLQLVRDELIS